MTKNNQNIMTFEKLSKVVKKSQRRERNKKKCCEKHVFPFLLLPFSFLLFSIIFATCIKLQFREAKLFSSHYLSARIETKIVAQI